MEVVKLSNGKFAAKITVHFAKTGDEEMLVRAKSKADAEGKVVKAKAAYAESIKVRAEILTLRTEQVKAYLALRAVRHAEHAKQGSFDF